MPRAKQQRHVGKARQLRKKMSLPEVLLWRELRLQNNVKFRRQHPLGRYVLDFYCAKAKAGIEIDGIAHELGDRADRDAERNSWLEDQGIKMVRVLAAEVLASPRDVAEALVRYCGR